MKTLSRVAWAGTAGTLTARHGAARVRTRERHRQVVAPAPAGSVVPARGQQAFDIRCITSEFGLPHWNGEWRRLLLASQSPEKIY
jgi:hypothetical protein